MWNNWIDVTKKIKDIAAEITTPHFKDHYSHSSEDEEEARGEHRGRSSSENGSQSLPYSGVTRRLHHDEYDVYHQTPVVPTRNVAHVSDAVHPPSAPLRSKEATPYGPPIRNAASRPVDDDGDDNKHKNKKDSNNNDDDGSTNNNGREQSVATRGSSTVSLTDPMGHAKASVAVSSGWTGNGNGQGGDEIIGLKEQVRQLLDDKQLMESQVLAYQDEVKATHDKTVSYYESLIKSLRDESSVDKTKCEQLKHDLANRDMECEELKAQLKQMRLRVEDLESAAVASTASHESTCALLTGRIEELQEELKILLEESEQRKDRRPSAKQASIPVAQTENEVMTSSPEPRHVDVSGSDEIVFLRHRVAELEASRSDEKRAKDELAQLLKEEQRTHREVSMEKDALISQGKEQAQRLSDLIKMLEGGEERRQAALKDDTIAFHDEINTLRTQLQEARDEATQSAEKEREKAKKELEHFATELESARRVNSEECKAREALVTELKEVRANASTAISQAAGREAKLTTELSAAEGMVKQLRNELVSIQHSNDQRESEQSSVAALTARRRELEADLAHLHGLLQQLEHTVTDCLVRADVELPSSNNISNSGGRGTGGTHVALSFSDKITLLASEFNRLLSVNQHADKMQKEWEYTYEQARSVNATLNQQVSEAWKTIGSLREELSMRDQSLSKIKQQLQAETQQHTDALHTMTIVTNELHALKEEKHVWETRVLESTSGAANHEVRLAEMTADMDLLRTALQDREEELTQTQRALENLQQVLDAFKLNKTRDVESRTADMQMEIDDLKAQLAEIEQSQEKHHAEVEALNTMHRKEIASKNIEIVAFHRKHTELRKALEETARQLNGDLMIDKRVISHLVVNFIHAFVGQRPESNEMLKVLSGLLNWDEAMQEKAGLLPGPSNPKPGQQGRRGIIGGIVSTVWRNPRPSQSGSHGVVDEDKGANARPSLAELWVDFLMRESDTAAGPGDGITSSQPGTTEGVEEAGAKQNPV